MLLIGTITLILTRKNLYQESLIEKKIKSSEFGPIVHHTDEQKGEMKEEINSPCNKNKYSPTLRIGFENVFMFFISMDTTVSPQGPTPDDLCKIKPVREESFCTATQLW
jgi:hypothetical protein